MRGDVSELNVYIIEATLLSLFLLSFRSTFLRHSGGLRPMSARNGQVGNRSKIAKTFDYVLCTVVQGSESLKQLVADISEGEYAISVFLVRANPKRYALCPII